MKLILLMITMVFTLQAITVDKLEQACKIKDGVSCRSLGVLYQVGKEIDKSYEKAKFYYEKACQLKDSKGCVLLGDLFYYGVGVDSDNSQAKQNYLKACKMKNKKACSRFKIVEKEDIEIEEQKAELDRLKKEQEELLQEVDLLDKI